MPLSIRNDHSQCTINIILIILMIMTLIIPLGARADESTNQAMLSLPEMTIQLGEQVIVSLLLDPNHASVISADLKITYDPNVVSVAEVKAGHIVSEWMMVSNLQTRGLILLALAGSRAVSISGDLVDITFGIVGGIEDITPLMLIQGKLNEGAISTSLENGFIIIEDVEPLDISGTPPSTVNAGTSFSFTPAVSGLRSGDTLTFSIQNKPGWADFNTGTGTLTGYPGNADVGTTSGIVITVTNSSRVSAFLDPFDLTVTQMQERVVEMNLPANWSMISLPVIPVNPVVSNLFPEAEVIYGFKKGIGYVRVAEGEKLEVGKGYWILLPSAHTYALSGAPIEECTLPAEDGWLMIGSCTSSAQATLKQGNIEVIYGFVPGIGYQRLLVSDNLEAGKGYWILLSNTIAQANLKIKSLSEK